MRANLLASVASAAVATFLAIGPLQAQSDDDQLKRKQAPAAQSESQPTQDEGAARPAGREAAGAADEQSGSMKKRKATSAEADDEEGAPDSKPATAASDEGDVKKRDAAAEGSDDADVQRRRKATTAETDDEDVTRKRKSTTAESGDADMKKKRDAASADTDDMDDATRRKTTAESGDDGDLNKKRNARSETETDDESATRREQASSGRSSGDVEVTGSINIDREKASRVHDRLVRRGSRTDIDIDISVGSTLPDRVVLQRVPDEIIEISPEFRGYEYTVVRDEIIIVEPRTKKVVEVIRKSGGKSASSKSGRSKLKLSNAQRERIRSVVREQRITRLDLDVDLGSDVPETVALVPLPDVVFTDVPELREYEYFVTNEEIVLVEPDTREVVEVIR
jgi:hypothetical protein